jgi:hypothetical protein
MSGESRAAHAGNARVSDPREGFFLRTGKRIERGHQFRIVLIGAFIRLDNNAQAFGVVRLKPRFDLFNRAGNGRMNRNRHKAGRFGYALAPLNLVAGDNNAFVRRAEMLINGNDNLFGKRGKLHGLSLGSVFPGIQFDSPAECAYSHEKAFSWSLTVNRGFSTPLKDYISTGYGKTRSHRRHPAMVLLPARMKPAHPAILILI